MKDPNVKDRTGEAAQSLRDRARDRSKKNSLQKAAEEFKDDIDSRLQLFRQTLQEGSYDEIANLLLESKRELEQHAKLNRFSSGSAEMAREFGSLVQAYSQKKGLLEKLETILESFRLEIMKTGATNELQQKSDHAAQNIEKIKQDLGKTSARLLNLRERIEYQVQKDRITEEKLLDSLKHCLVHLSSSERGKMEVMVRQRIKTLSIDDRVRFLSQIIEQLAQNVPAIRRTECERLLEEARTLSRRKNHAGALQTLDQLFKFDRKHLQGHRLRAEMYKSMGNQFAFVCELRMICEIETAEARDFYALAQVQIANGKTEDAYELMEKAVKKNPLPVYLELLGDMAGTRGLWYRAIQAYQDILKKNPRQIRAKHKLGNALFEDKREEEAFNILREAIELRDDNANSRVCVGRKFRQLKATFLAEQCFSRAVELEPRNVSAHYWWGMMAYDRGDFQKALTRAKKTIELDPERVRNKTFYARCQSAMGRYQEALDILRPLATQQTPPPPVDVLLTFSEICRTANRVEEGLEIIEPFQQRFPHQPQIKAEYGLLLVQAGRFAEAAPYMSHGA